MDRSWSWAGRAVLFDMDGTLVDSGASVLRAWRWLADELDLPWQSLQAHLHGIPAGQVLSEVAPQLAVERRIELARQINDRQVSDTEDVLAVPGALSALAELPTARWAVVTSAPRDLAIARLRAAGLPLPRTLITSEQTPDGKPAPGPYLLAADLVHVEPGDCLVVEDSPAGVAAGLAAGCQVLGVLTTSSRLDGVSAAITDLSEVSFTADRFSVRAHVPAS